MKIVKKTNFSKQTTGGCLGEECLNYFFGTTSRVQPDRVRQNFGNILPEEPLQQEELHRNFQQARDNRIETRQNRILARQGIPVQANAQIAEEQISVVEPTPSIFNFRTLQEVRPQEAVQQNILRPDLSYPVPTDDQIYGDTYGNSTRINKSNKHK